MVGLSGGVDSAVAAAILKQQGYEVCGLTLNLLMKNSKDMINDAKKVADKLNIEHKVLDLAELFKNQIIEYFVKQYKDALTPNPCVMCNQKIKFGAMLDYALNQGFDYIATGHYANIIYNEATERWLLKKSLSCKDQSYFLYGLSQHQLSHSLFPIGNFEKEYVRRLAKEYNLPVFSKSDSQDICFISNESPAEFIKNYSSFSLCMGEFQDKNGNKLGKHNGIINYTVGQRKGLGVALGFPAYVVKMDSSKNTVILGNKEDGACTQIIAKDVNFIAFENLETSIKAFAKIRYRAKEVPCILEPDENEFVKIMFEVPVYFPAPGQSIVFYDDTGVVIGGGIII